MKPLLLVLLATPALADDTRFVSSAGLAYDLIAQTPDGVTIRSRGPETYHVGAAGLPVTGIETVLLRPDCTAKSALGGEGAWMRQGDGFQAFFVEGSGLWFEHQAPPEGAGCDS